MPFIFKILKQAQAVAANSNLPVYTVGASPTSSIVSNIRFYNSTGVPASVVLAFRAVSSNVATNFARMNCPAGTSTVFNTELSLGALNVVEVSTSGSVLDIVAFGVDRTP
jgi:hypothetical protein